MQRWKIPELNYCQTTQQLDIKLSIDEGLLKKQSAQVEKAESTLKEIQTKQSTLVDFMTKIQDHVMQDKDQDETSSVDEKPSVSESILSQARTSGETSGISAPYRRSFQEDFEEQMKLMKENFPE